MSTLNCILHTQLFISSLGIAMMSESLRPYFLKQVKWRHSNQFPVQLVRSRCYITALRQGVQGYKHKIHFRFMRIWLMFGFSPIYCLKVSSHNIQPPNLSLTLSVCDLCGILQALVIWYKQECVSIEGASKGSLHPINLFTSVLHQKVLTFFHEKRSQQPNMRPNICLCIWRATL